MSTTGSTLNNSTALRSGGSVELSVASKATWNCNIWEHASHKMHQWEDRAVSNQSTVRYLLWCWMSGTGSHQGVGFQKCAIQTKSWGLYQVGWAPSWIRVQKSWRASQHSVWRKKGLQKSPKKNLIRWRWQLAQSSTARCPWLPQTVVSIIWKPIPILFYVVYNLLFF